MKKQKELMSGTTKEEQPKAVRIEKQANFNGGSHVIVEKGASPIIYIYAGVQPERGRKRGAEIAEEVFTEEKMGVFVRNGFLTDDFMPASWLTRGQVAMLAHFIAERLKMKKFWGIFEERWGYCWLSNYYTKYTKDPHSADFARRLFKLS